MDNNKISKVKIYSTKDGGQWISYQITCQRQVVIKHVEYDFVIVMYYSFLCKLEIIIKVNKQSICLSDPNNGVSEGGRWVNSLLDPY